MTEFLTIFAGAALGAFCGAVLVKFVRLAWAIYGERK